MLKRDTGKMGRVHRTRQLRQHPVAIQQGSASINESDSSVPDLDQVPAIASTSIVLPLGATISFARLITRIPVRCVRLLRVFAMHA